MEVRLQPGDHFDIILPDGSLLNVEQTQDDFSMVRANGTVAYTCATSESAKTEDAWDRKLGENPTPARQTTGFN